MKRGSGATTIAEVAKQAGVSPATVSRIMNDRFFGDPQVSERVRSVAAQLSYSPSHFARSLALGQTSAVGFVVPDLSNPAFQAMLSSLSKAAAADGYRVLVADSAESAADEAPLANEIRRRCDALILCAPRMPEEELVALAASLQPLVVINRVSDRAGVPSLSIDYGVGIQELAQHLYDLGHRHIAFVAGPHSSVSNRQRREGLTAFQQRRRGVRIEWLPGGAATEDGAAAAEAVQASGVTAALAYNDLLAIGLLGGLTERGVRVPEDISVTGFDDIPFARFSSPPLTTVSVPHTELGRKAWSCMRSLIRGESRTPDAAFRPKLVVRGSTAQMSAWAGTDSYDELDERGQATVRARWDEQMAARLARLDLASEFADAGRSWTEADKQGRPARHDGGAAD